jgi:hypothetical protein
MEIYLLSDVILLVDGGGDGTAAGVPSFSGEERGYLASPLLWKEVLHLQLYYKELSKYISRYPFFDFE